MPDFAALARSLGLRGDTLAGLADALASPGPCVIDLPIHEQANAYPMVPPGAANHHMIAEPELAAAHV